MGGSVSVRAGCTAIHGLRNYKINPNPTVTLTPGRAARTVQRYRRVRTRAPCVSLAAAEAREGTARGMVGCGRKDSPAASPRLVRVARLLNSGEHMADGVPCLFKLRAGDTELRASMLL